MNYLTFDNASTSISVSGTGNLGAGMYDLKLERGIHPSLYFKYVKKKFGILEQHRMNKVQKKLEKAFDAAVENGQCLLGENVLKRLDVVIKENIAYAKGIRLFIENDDLRKFKHNIKKGHISDTKYEDFTRIIPNQIVKKKKKYEEVFDSFVIYHYWDPDNEGNKEMDDDTRQAMRDPILFGQISGSSRFYFIADWVDEECDLTFDEIVDELGKDDEDFMLKENIAEPF